MLLSLKKLITETIMDFMYMYVVIKALLKLAPVPLIDGASSTSSVIIVSIACVIFAKPLSSYPIERPFFQLQRHEFAAKSYQSRIESHHQ